LLSQNLGNCKAFNQGLALATGDFVIDFSTDDVMLPDRVEKQIKFFRKAKRRCWSSFLPMLLTLMKMESQLEIITIIFLKRS